MDLPSKLNKFKLPIFLLLILLLGLGIYYLFAGNLPKNFRMGITKEVKPKLIKETKLAEAESISSPGLFIAELEYELSSSLITQLSINRINGAPVPYLSNKPKTFPGDFLYKIEVLSSAGQVEESGWRLIPSETLEQHDGKIKFKIITTYFKDGFVRVYNNGEKLVWIGKME